MKKNEEKSIKTRRKGKGDTTFITMKKEGNSYGTAGSQGTARFSLWSMEARG
jgi:hypothetical protein